MNKGHTIRRVDAGDWNRSLRVALFLGFIFGCGTLVAYGLRLHPGLQKPGNQLFILPASLLSAGLSSAIVVWLFRKSIRCKRGWVAFFSCLQVLGGNMVLYGLLVGIASPSINEGRFMIGQAVGAGLLTAVFALFWAVWLSPVLIPLAYLSQHAVRRVLETLDL